MTIRPSRQSRGANSKDDVEFCYQRRKHAAQQYKKTVARTFDSTVDMQE